MKKIVLSVVFLFLVQFATAQANFGARIGLNSGSFAEFENKNITENYDVNRSLSIMINMDIDVPFSTVFSFRTGIGLVIKGMEIDYVPTMTAISPDTNWSLLYRMNYLEVPLLLVTRVETDFYGNFFFGVGPTLSLGVGGKMDLFAEHKDNKGQNEYSYDIIWGKKDIDPKPGVPYNYIHFKRFDLGLGLMFAYQLPKSGLTFTLNANQGLRNISPNDNMKIKTSYVGLSIGFTMKN